MREILFRGIPKDDATRYFFADIWKDNCEGSFVYGSLIISKGRYYICVSALYQINSCINNGVTSMIEVIPETVGQYTGLTDKNGKKIFEGDIIKANRGIDTDIGYVMYDERTASHIAMVNKEECLCFIDWFVAKQQNDSLYIEVIGNIHDNPEVTEGAIHNG